MVWRVLGWLLLLLAAAIALRDAAEFVERGDWRLAPVGQLWFDLHAASLNVSQAFVQRQLLPELWDWIARPVLVHVPAVLPPLIVGLLCLAKGLRRREPEGPGTGRRRRRRRRGGLV